MYSSLILSFLFSFRFLFIRSFYSVPSFIHSSTFPATFSTFSSFLSVILPLSCLSLTFYFMLSHFLSFFLSSILSFIINLLLSLLLSFIFPLFIPCFSFLFPFGFYPLFLAFCLPRIVLHLILSFSHMPLLSPPSTTTTIPLPMLFHCRAD